MFDFRYHVASLAAVFLALIIGILVGVAISGTDLLSQGERRNLLRQIDDLRQQRDAERNRTREQEAATAFAEASYEAVMANRLRGLRIGTVFIGSIDEDLNTAVTDALRDADARVARVRAISVPLRMETLQQVLASRPALVRYRGDGQLAELGRELGREFVSGGQTPLWNALTGALVEERRGSGGIGLDAVVVARPAEPQQGPTARFLTGLYDGLEGGIPVVGVEALTSEHSAVDVFRRSGFSSVDDVDTIPGKVALAVLLAGGRPGHYGLKETAETILPPVEPVTPEP